MDQQLGSGGSNIGIGFGSLYTMVGGQNNVAIGYQSCYKSTSTNATDNIGVGTQTLYNNTSGASNIALGTWTLYSNTTGSDNFGLGYNALLSNTTGSYNTAIGVVAMRQNTTGGSNVAIGLSALRYANNNNSVGIGSQAGQNSPYDNVTCLGYGTDCTGANQVQLGNSSTTTYVYGTVQNRSDARDKTNIRDTILGLNFITKLRAVDWQWNYRDNYIIYTDTDADKPEITNLPNDGSKAGTRFHHGVIAQEVKQVMTDLNIDFGGYQDHSINGGEDVLTIGYDELVGPLIKAVQELNQIVINLQSQIDELKNKGV